MAKRKPVSLKIVEDSQGRFVIATYRDGSTTKLPVEPGGKAKRKPRKPIARATPVRRDV